MEVIIHWLLCDYEYSSKDYTTLLLLASSYEKHRMLE